MLKINMIPFGVHERERVNTILAKFLLNCSQLLLIVVIVVNCLLDFNNMYLNTNYKHLIENVHTSKLNTVIKFA